MCPEETARDIGCKQHRRLARSDLARAEARDGTLSGAAADLLQIIETIAARAEVYQ